MLSSYRFFLKGRIPSKKNSKQIIPNKSKKGRPFFLVSSQKHKEWHKDAVAQLSMQHPRKFENIDNIIINFTFGDKRKTDLSNKAESVMDLLVDTNIINDDNWIEVPKLSLSGRHKKGIFGAVIIINFETNIEEPYLQTR